MKRIIPAILLVILAATGRAQKPEAYIYKLPPEEEIILDGLVDPLWNSGEEYRINKNFRDETPTIDRAVWKGFWNDTAIFILVDVLEDDWYATWFSGFGLTIDAVHLYFDVNEILVDGGSPAHVDPGHYQIYHEFMMGGQSGDYANTYINGYYGMNSSRASDTYDSTVISYTIEYSINFNDLNDNTENPLDPNSRDIGFDVTIVDYDHGTSEIRQRAVWSSDQEECWNNMDDAGLMHFVDEVIVSASEPEAEKNTLEIFPNPAEEEINFNKSVERIRIYNSAGEMVLILNEETTEINITHLNDGVYVVRAVDRSGNTVSQIFIKQ